jgi:hypothetical protein
MPGMHCTLDIEASGFGRHGYPIEIGYVRDDGQSWCTLIRPLPEWTHWDPEAERVHGIARATLLAHGRTPAAVAQALNEALDGRTVYCDAWAHDFAWLALLYEAAAMRPRFRLESVRRLLDDGALARLDRALQAARDEAGGQRHRASADARVLQRALGALLTRTNRPSAR